MSTTVAPGALAGKRIVVIGGTAGLGLSAVKAFVAAGARVVAVGLKPENVAAAQREVGDGATMMCGDAAQSDTAVSAVAKAVSAFGGLDGLYHVAGGSGRRWGDGPMHQISDEGWEATLKLNLTSLFYSNRAAVRQFLAQGTGGTILNIGSVLGFSPSHTFFATHAYATAKAAVEGFTKSCAGLLCAAENSLQCAGAGGDGHADGPARRQRTKRSSRSSRRNNRSTADASASPPILTRRRFIS